MLVLPEEPVLRACLDYWNKIRGDRSMPSRADLDPVDIPTLLPYVYILDVLDGASDFRYRLIGSDVNANTRQDYTGRLLSEILQEGTQRFLVDVYIDVAINRRPRVDTVAYRARSGNQKYYDNLVMPLSADGEQVNILFGCCVHRRNAPALGASDGLSASRGR